MTLMHQLLWNVMQMAIALAKMDLVVKNVMPAKGDLLEANVMNANLMSLVTNVMHVNQITSIIHHVKVCCHKRDSNSGLFNNYIRKILKS